MDTGQLTTTQKTRHRPVTFPGAAIRIDADELWVGNQVFPMKDIWEAQVRSKGQPAQIVTWLFPIAIVIIAIMLIFILHITFFWFAFYPAYFVLQRWRRTAKEIKRALHFTLMVDTTYGMLQAYASWNYLYLKIMERAINKAVRDYILESGDNTPLIQP